MPLLFVLDEQVRGGGLWQAIQQHNLSGVDTLNVVRVGDPPDLPIGTSDPIALLWGEHTGRILISFDKSTLPSHLGQHLQAGHHSPGVFLIRPGFTIPEILGFLILAAHAGDPLDYVDAVTFIP